MKKRCYCELSEEYDAALDGSDVSAPEVHVHNIVSTTQIMTDGSAVDIEVASASMRACGILQ